MSKIKGIKTVNQKVTVTRECDVCHVQATNSKQYALEWHHFSESHQGWGNGSSDSYSYHDVCSIDCFLKQIQDSLPNLLDYADDGAEIADMPAKFAQKLIDRLLEVKSE